MTASTVVTCFTQLFSLFGVPSYIHTDQGSNFMSKEVKDFLLQKNVATSRTTPYNPEGNGQIESLNGTLWKSVTLALQSLGLPQSCWQDVLPDALHSIRSLLCTSTNATPHERFLLFQRRSTTGASVPTWLTESQTALLSRYVRRSKQDPLCEEVELLEVNPSYAHVRKSDGTEKTVSIKHLAPPGKPPATEVSVHLPIPGTPPAPELNVYMPPIETVENVHVEQTVQPVCDPVARTESPPQPVTLRRSQRSTKGQAPTRLDL